MPWLVGKGAQSPAFVVVFLLSRESSLPRSPLRHRAILEAFETLGDALDLQLPFLAVAIVSLGHPPGWFRL